MTQLLGEAENELTLVGVGRSMRFVFLSLFMTVAAAIATENSARANTVYFDISAQAGFQQRGAGGIFGNGVVFTSPVYNVGFGDTVDFGTVSLVPDPPDGRTNCYFTDNCYGQYAWTAWFTTNGVGGPSSPPFDLGFPTFVRCPIATGCPTIQFPLEFFLPSDANGVQFAFQGTSVSFAAPVVPEPSTWAMMLIGFAALGYMGFRLRRRSVAT